MRIFVPENPILACDNLETEIPFIQTTPFLNLAKANFHPTIFILPYSNSSHKTSNFHPLFRHCLEDIKHL
jgi:hypothetical protein